MNRISSRKDRHFADEQRQRLGLHLLGARVAPTTQAEDDHQHHGDDADGHRAPMEMRAAEQRVQRRKVGDVGQEAGADVLEVAVERADELAHQHVAGQAAEDQHAGEGDDERGNLRVGDKIALHATDQAAEHQRQRDHHLPRQFHVDVEARHVESDHEHRRRPADEADDRPDRQVDVEGDDDQQHAEGHDDHVAVLQDQVRQVQRRERNAAGEEVEERHDHQQRQQQTVVAQAALPDRGLDFGFFGAGRRHGFVFHWTVPYCRMIDAMIFSWVAPAAGISSTSFPSFMT